MTGEKLGELNGRWTMFFKVSMFFLPACLTALSLYVGWMHSAVADLGHSVADIRVSVAKIQANRFTSAHGLEVWKEIAAIRETIAALPPDRFEDEVAELARNQQLILQDLAALKSRILRE